MNLKNTTLKKLTKKFQRVMAEGYLDLSFKTTQVENLPVECSSVLKEEESKYINN